MLLLLLSLTAHLLCVGDCSHADAENDRPTSTPPRWSSKSLSQESNQTSTTADNSTANGTGANWYYPIRESHGDAPYRLTADPISSSGSFGCDTYSFRQSGRLVFHIDNPAKQQLRSVSLLTSRRENISDESSAVEGSENQLCRSYYSFHLPTWNTEPIYYERGDGSARRGRAERCRVMVCDRCEQGVIEVAFAHYPRIAIHQIRRSNVLTLRVVATTGRSSQLDIDVAGLWEERLARCDASSVPRSFEVNPLMLMSEVDVYLLVLQQSLPRPATVHSSTDEQFLAAHFFCLCGLALLLCGFRSTRYERFPAYMSDKRVHKKQALFRVIQERWLRQRERNDKRRLADLVRARKAWFAERHAQHNPPRLRDAESSFTSSSAAF